METYIAEKIPDRFECVIWVYNNLYNIPANHVEFKEYLDILNNWYPKKQEIYYYIKALLIDKILRFSGDIIDINYSKKEAELVDLPVNNKKVMEYITKMARLCLTNRMAVPDRKSRKLFMVDLFQDTNIVLGKYGLLVNVVIVYLFDMCTINI